MMSKRMISLAVALLFIASATAILANPSTDVEVDGASPIGNWTDAGNYSTTWYDKDRGRDTFTISNAADLAGLAYLVTIAKSTYFATRTINIDATAGVIDLSAHYWTPIGTASLETAFKGTFDGKSTIIKGLYIGTKTSSASYAGLFGYISNTVRNVCIEDAEIYGGSYTGSVVGYSLLGSIQNCYNTGSISGGYNTGGIVGSISNGSVKNCYNTGSVSGSGIVGGIAGACSDPVENCYNTGSVSASSSVGGIVGSSSRGADLSNCYNRGVVNGTGSSVGPIVGSNNGDNPISNCYWLDTIGFAMTVNGHLGLEQMTGDNAVSTMRFGSGWKIKANEDGTFFFPQLTVFANSTNDAIKANSLESVSASQPVMSQSETYVFNIKQKLSALDPGEYVSVLPNVPGTFIWDNPNRVLDTLGESKVKISFMPNDMTAYVPTSMDVDISVIKIQPVLTQSETYMFRTGQKLADVDPSRYVSVLPKTPGVYTWENGGTVLTTVGTFTAKIIFTPTTEYAIYDSAYLDVNISVKITQPEMYQYATCTLKVGQKLGDVDPAEYVRISPNVPGTFTWEDPGKVLNTVGYSNVEVIFTPDDPTQSNAASLQVDIRVTEISVTKDPDSLLSLNKWFFVAILAIAILAIVAVIATIYFITHKKR